MSKFVDLKKQWLFENGEKNRPLFTSLFQKFIDVYLFIFRSSNPISNLQTQTLIDLIPESKIVLFIRVFKKQLYQQEKRVLEIDAVFGEHWLKKWLTVPTLRIEQFLRENGMRNLVKHTMTKSDWLTFIMEECSSRQDLKKNLEKAFKSTWDAKYKPSKEEEDEAESTDDDDESTEDDEEDVDIEKNSKEKQSSSSESENSEDDVVQNHHSKKQKSERVESNSSSEDDVEEDEEEVDE